MPTPRTRTATTGTRTADPTAAVLATIRAETSIRGGDSPWIGLATFRAAVGLPRDVVDPVLHQLAADRVIRLGVEPAPTRTDQVHALRIGRVRHHLVALH